MINKLIGLLGENRVKNVLKVTLVLLLFLLLGTFFAQSYAKYETQARLSANIDKAIYLLKDEKLTFNIDPDLIIPSDTDNEYSFTVSNYNGSDNGDINLRYYIQVKTTTNLPISIRLYRNESNSPSSTNIANGYTLVNDEDGAWYKLYNQSPTYEFQYNVRRQDTYLLVISYPEIYKTYLQYAGVPENIEVTIYSEQKV